MGLLAALLSVCQDTVSLFSMSAGLIVFSPWLMALLIAVLIVAVISSI